MTDNTTLHRGLAPIPTGAWEQIDQEAARTFKRLVAGRRAVDVVGPLGADTAAVNTGRVEPIAAPAEGISANRRLVAPLVELRVPFALRRCEIDAVARGASDSDWQPVKDAATALATAEDRAVFDGFEAAGITGLRQGAALTPVTLPTDAREYPDAVARALSELRLAGVEGPFALVLDTDAFTAVQEVRDSGYPIRAQLEQTIDGGLVWCPAIGGGAVISGRGGDFELTLGQDLSIGYLGHDDDVVRLYLQESLTFRVLAAEAVVPLYR